MFTRENGQNHLQFGAGGISFALVLALVLFVPACEQSAADVYSPKEWRDIFQQAGGWIPLPLPDSKYRPGAIIKVSDEGVRWIDHLEACRYPEEVLKPERSRIPAITFTKARQFDAQALVNFKGVSAGPAFDRISKVRLEVKDHGADAFRLLNLKVWLEEPENQNKVSPVCISELSKADRYLVTEAFRVSKGAYTLYDKTGAAVKLSAPALAGILKFEPEIKYSVEGDSQLIIEEPVYFAVRRAVKVGEDFEVLGAPAGEPETADQKIEALYLSSSGQEQ